MYQFSISLDESIKPKVQAIKSLTDTKLAAVLRPIILKEIERIYNKIPEKSRKLYDEALSIDEIL